MALYEISGPPVEPVSLEEAKNHLRLSADFYDDDEYIKVLISGARAEAESHTGGRVFAFREWVWEPEGTMLADSIYEVPISPVTEVSISRLDTNEDVPVSDYRFVRASLSAHGSPLFARIIPKVDLENVLIHMKAGWPNEVVSRRKISTEAPKFEPAFTTYTENSITLQFDKPVNGEATPKAFSVVVDNSFHEVMSVTNDGGRITLHFAEPLEEGARVKFSYVSGFLHDIDDNFVLPLMDVQLPEIDFGRDPTPFTEVEEEEILVSTVPKLVKSWMLVRIATLYQQRSEIAIQAGKTSNSFFPRAFIGGLLDAYTIEKA